MDILNEDEFKKIVEAILSKKGVEFTAIASKHRKRPQLDQEIFFDLNRTHHKHAPDILLTSKTLPCELKSPKEIYDVCRYSRAHLCSYLLQIIYGQCLSYADLFRPDNEFLSIFLMFPKRVRNDLPCFGDIEDVFSCMLQAQSPCYLRQMSLRSVTFEVPEFIDTSGGSLYGKIGTDYEVLATKINYVPNQRVHRIADKSGSW